MAQKQIEDDMFFKWLSPSYWLVEGQLSSARKKRGKETLEWARNMKEFQVWRNCPVTSGPEERILWIRGTLGVGKTIMAGYFIELLKCLYSDAIVVYFFCRKGEAGLTKARDIIRTLIYQCIQYSPDVRLSLDLLRRNGLAIDDNIGVGLLFDRLIRDPLNKANKEIFIVLDGLDEADSALDTIERPSRPEMDILLEHLASLPMIRLLLVSRPDADIKRIIPASTLKPLGKDDNKEDIASYIRQAINDSERLRKHFENEKIDPFEYFNKKANGIFLWVVVVLHQLAQIKHRKIFRKYLDGFSNAPGDMERLYCNIFLRFEGEDRRWILEILRWVIVAPRQLNVETLREAMEWSLEDSISEFRTFLEVEGGSLLHVVPDTNDVELVHETLKTFLVN